MRFEGKHKMFKKAARRTSFKNVCQALCKHHQWLHAYNVYCNSTFTAVTIETGKGKSNSSVVCHLVFNWGGLLLQQLWFQTHHHWVMLHSWIPSYLEWWHMNYTGNTVTLFCLLIINFDCLFVDSQSIFLGPLTKQTSAGWWLVNKILLWGQCRNLDFFATLLFMDHSLLLYSFLRLQILLLLFHISVHMSSLNIHTQCGIFVFSLHH